MKKRIVCALFAASLMAIAALAGCSGGQASAPAPASSAAPDAPAESNAAPAEQSSQQSAAQTDAVMGKLSAKKIGSVKLDTNDVEFTGSGYIYQISGKYGVVSLDGTKDTGAKYAAAKEVDGSYSNKGYIAVRELSGDNKKTRRPRTRTPR